MRNVIDFYQPWPKPCPEFAAQMREAERGHREAFDAQFRPIDEAPRDGTEIMVSDRKSLVLTLFGWRTKWCEVSARWVRWFGDEQGWLPTAGEPKFWLHKEAVREVPPVMIRMTPALALDLTA
jgi:hypothetical protein